MDDKNDEMSFDTLVIGLESNDTETQIINDKGWHVCYVEFDPTDVIAQRIVDSYNNYQKLVLTLNSLLDSPVSDEDREKALELLYEITGSLGPLNEEGIKKWLKKN